MSKVKSTDLCLKLCDPNAVVHHQLVVLLWHWTCAIIWNDAYGLWVQFNCISDNGGVANITGRTAYSSLIKII